MQIDPDIARLLDKLVRVNRSASACATLDPPLSESDVAAFEARHGIVLPAGGS